ncbi:Uncharacterised protein [Vibrio cholerae]|nr:Uncharacterised protein [Vibrio cholerae]
MLYREHHGQSTLHRHDTWLQGALFLRHALTNNTPSENHWRHQYHVASFALISSCLRHCPYERPFHTKTSNLKASEQCYLSTRTIRP